MQFADILLPVPLPGLFTYRVPEKYKARLKTGIRVVVLFGPRKLYSGIVYKLHNNPPEGYTIKDIIDIVDNQPVVNSIQLKFWDWMAQYYMCTPGEVCKAALPSGLKLESETRLYLNRDKQSGISLDHQEELLLDLLKRKTPITIKDISKQSGISHPARQINKLITEGLITAEERIKETYRRKTIKYIKLTEAYRKEERWKGDKSGRIDKISGESR